MHVRDSAAQLHEMATVFTVAVLFWYCEKVDRSVIRAGSPPEFTSKLLTPTIQATSKLTTWPVPRSPVTASETDREAESDRHPKGDGIKW